MMPLDLTPNIQQIQGGMTISKDTMGYKQQSPDVANKINNQVSSTNIELGKNRSNLQIKKDLKDTITRLQYIELTWILNHIKF